MAVQQDMGGSPTSQTPVWRIVLGVLVFIGLWALVAPRPAAVTPAVPPAPQAAAASPTPDYTAHPQEDMARIRLLAKQTGGDWTRLSPADQQLLNGLTGGHGAGMFMMLARQEHSVPGRPSARP